ncbi:MAG: polyphenol oxidase family protein [Spirochaetaceae bacterium]|nr:polyphenol oxidase family protein [Spirochaetaceae bacterium]
MALYPFNLEFSASLNRAEFPFIIDGVPVRGPRCVLSSREAGDMRYTPASLNPSREAFFASLGLDSQRVRSCVQVHSQKVVMACGSEYRRDIQADGLVISGAEAGTDDMAGTGATAGSPPPVLAVTAADCLPVFLWDTSSGALGLVHSGWKGTGIVLEALDLMEKHWGVLPGQVAAVLGPCIQHGAYQVEEGRVRQFEERVAARLKSLPEHGVPEHRQDNPPPAFFPGPLVYGDRDGVHFYLDLQSANAGLLASRGVSHIAYCKDCTFTGHRLGSYRREGKNYTRMAALLGWF